MKNEFSEPASAKYTADENSTTPAMQGRKHRFSGFNAPGDSVPHIAVAHGRHRDHRPPERVRYRFEEAVLRAGLREVDRRREQHHTCNAHKRKARVKMVYVIVHAAYVIGHSRTDSPITPGDLLITPGTSTSDGARCRRINQDREVTGYDRIWTDRILWGRAGAPVRSRVTSRSHLERPRGVYGVVSAGSVRS